MVKVRFMNEFSNLERSRAEEEMLASAIGLFTTPSDAGVSEDCEQMSGMDVAASSRGPAGEQHCISASRLGLATISPATFGSPLALACVGSPASGDAARRQTATGVSSTSRNFVGVTVNGDIEESRILRFMSLEVGPTVRSRSVDGSDGESARVDISNAVSTKLIRSSPRKQDADEAAGIGPTGNEISQRESAAAEKVGGLENEPNREASSTRRREHCNELSS